MTHYLIVYDITDDSIRNRVSNKLKDYGLERIQYSAFVGELQPRRYRSLVGELKKIISKAKGERKVIHLFPLPVDSIRKVEVVGEWQGERRERVEVM